MGLGSPEPRHGYFDFARWDPCAVNAFPAGRSAFGVAGMLANGWEWTSSQFAPFAGFEPFPFYAGYSANFFDGPASRNERRLAAHRPEHVAKLLSELVSTPLPVRLCRIPLREQLISRPGGEYANPSDGGKSGEPVRGGHQCRSPESAAEGASSKYLYDTLGSKLFEVISELPEYGLTRADERLLRAHAHEIAQRIPRDVMVCELGSGSGRKTRWILEALSRRRRLDYFPVEISAAALAVCRRELSDIESVGIVGLEREYLDGLLEVAARRRDGQHLLVLFLGSTDWKLQPSRGRKLPARDSHDPATWRFAPPGYRPRKADTPAHRCLPGRSGRHLALSI